MNSDFAHPGSRVRATVVFVVLIAAIAAILVGAIDSTSPAAALNSITVEPSVFRRELVRNGVVEPQDSVVVRSECFWKTHLLSILPEGTIVRKGDVVAVLDSSEIEEYARTRELLLIKYQNRLDAAIKEQEIVAAQNERRLDQAEFAQESAAAVLKEYVAATHPREVSDLRSEVRLMDDQVESAKVDLDRTAALCMRGLDDESSLRRQQAVFDRLCQKRDGLIADLSYLQEFSHPRQLLLRRGNAENLTHNLERTRLKNSLAEIRNNRNILAYRRVLQIYERYYKRALESIEACTMRAPCDGQVIYGQSWSSRSRGVTVEEGASVRFQQEIFQIPNERKRRVRVPLNETQAWNLPLHARVSVQIEGLEDPVTGSVREIARYAKVRSSWTPDEKDYWIEIELHPNRNQLKQIAPRADAEVTFVISQRQDVLQVPVNAVAGQCDCHFVLVDGPEGVVPRRVMPGENNGESVCISAGLKPGERVVAELQEQQHTHLMQLAEKLLQQN